MIKLDFDEVKKYCNENEIESLTEYHDFHNAGKLPADYPYSIDGHLKRFSNRWNGSVDFFGKRKQKDGRRFTVTLDEFKLFITKNKISNLSQYKEWFHKNLLPANYPLYVDRYFKRYYPDEWEGFTSIKYRELKITEHPESLKLFITKPLKQPKLKLPKIPKILTPKTPNLSTLVLKFPKPPKPKKPKYVKVVKNYAPYIDATKITRTLGLYTEQDWVAYSKNISDNDWTYPFPKGVKSWYKKTGEWISWSNFLIGDKVPPQRLTHGEREIFILLRDENIYFEINKKFPDLKGGKLSYDFFIPSLNTLIEYDGIYHFYHMGKTNAEFLVSIDNDIMKDKYAEEKGYTLIRISYIKHSQIPKILFEKGIIKNENAKLLKQRSKNNHRLDTYIKSTNYRVYSQAGKYTYDNIYDIRQLHLSGCTRIEIEQKLNLKITADVYRDILNNRTYFDPNFKRIPVPPKKPKIVKAKTLIPDQQIKLRNIKIIRKKYYDDNIAPLLVPLKELKDKLSGIQKKINSRPVTFEPIVVTVSDRTVNDLNSFIEFANYKHYDRYDYSEFVYLNKDKNGKIICKKHGGFYQTAKNHISVGRPSQCPKCAIENKGNPLPWRDVRDLKVFKEEKRFKRIKCMNTLNKLNLEKNEVIDKITPLKIDLKNKLPIYTSLLRQEKKLRKQYNVMIKKLQKS